jgi:hypothetical protein
VMQIKQLQHDGQLTPYLVDAPHTLVLQERVSRSLGAVCVPI